MLFRTFLAEGQVMNRRVCLQKLFLGNFIGLSFLLKPNTEPIKVTYKSVPKSQTAFYKSVNDFFGKFYGSSSGAFNRQNMQNGRILSLKAKLSSDKKTVLAEYVYKNKSAFIECEKMWEKYCPKFKDRVKHIIVNIA